MLGYFNLNKILPTTTSKYMQTADHLFWMLTLSKRKNNVLPNPLFGLYKDTLTTADL